MRATPSLSPRAAHVAGARPDVHRCRGEIGNDLQDHPEPCAVAAVVRWRPGGDWPFAAAGLDRQPLHHRRGDAARVLVLRAGLQRPRHDRTGHPVLDSAGVYSRTEIRQPPARATASSIFGRLRPGATVQQVQAQLDALLAANVKRFPAVQLHRARHVQLGDAAPGSADAPHPPHVVSALGGRRFVLLIGAINLANLSLARGQRRGGGNWRRGSRSARAGCRWRASSSSKRSCRRRSAAPPALAVGAAILQALDVRRSGEPAERGGRSHERRPRSRSSPPSRWWSVS